MILPVVTLNPSSMSAQRLFDEQKDLLKDKLQKLENNNSKILICQAQVETLLKRLHVEQGAKLAIRNKATVWYVYGDAIVYIIIDSFGFIIEIKETASIEESQVDVTSGSKTDYCCWRLYKEGKSERPVCVPVLETKHEK